MTRLARPLLRTTLGAALLAACAPAVRSSAEPRAQPPRILAVVLVDSVPWENAMSDGWLRRVAVRGTWGTDTLAGIVVRDEDAPVIVGDSVVHGLRAQEDLVVGLFTYDARTRRVRRVDPPPEWVPFAGPRLAPDGRHVAYLAQADDGRGYGAVATVPDGRVVYRGPHVRMLETDAGVDHVVWHDASRFEIRIDLSHEVGGTQRLRGTVRPPTAAVDTVRVP